ncbi:MAG TPA: ester cyclase, partial [Thermomicrobiales bacterium]|nr:ester cyclase [Thermomicrobiales bacterium]
GEIVPREMLADRDKVVARVSLTGTHLAEFQGVPPSGKRMIADGTETFQFRHGVIVESWSLFGPLVEMEKLRSFEQMPSEPKPKRSFLQRLLNRGKHRPEDEEAA